MATESLSRLLTRYDVAGPRYTSYPTAPHFRDDFGPADYAGIAVASNGDPIPRPLSLYAHIPFCHSLCYYCACSKIITRHPEKADVYLHYLEREITLQARLFDADRTVLQLHLGGGTPTYLDDHQLWRLMSAIDRQFTLKRSADREFSIEIDPRAVRPETIPVLGDLGFNRISIGVQDFDPVVQAAVNRIQPREQTVRVMEQAREAGFHAISLDLIYGLPRQTPASFDRTLSQVLELRPERLSVYSYAHLPDRIRAQRLIRQADMPAPTDKLRMLELTIERLTEAGYRHIGMDHFALPDSELARALDNGSLQRNFQGYSTHGDCDLIGLGMTSIGSISGCYHQNVHGLRDYYAALDRGELPIVRGLVPDEEDRLRRAVIQQILCRAWLDFQEIEQAFEINFAGHFAWELEAMKPLEQDELIRLGERGVEILPLGRLLLRNIAMVFDARLRQGLAPVQHSRTV